MDPTKGGKKNLELYQLLCHLLEREQICVNKVRESEAEVSQLSYFLSSKTTSETITSRSYLQFLNLRKLVGMIVNLVVLCLGCTVDR